MHTSVESRAIPLCSSRGSAVVHGRAGTYAHVIRSDEDKVRAVVDETLGQTAEDWLRTEGVS